jgi:fructose-1,6-bisphosphatase II / sedoheptulose-1,7-bisphosphatase
MEAKDANAASAIVPQTFSIVDRAAKWGVTDLNRKYALNDLVSGDVVFSATGVTDGSMLRGVHRDGDFITTESVVMRSATGTVRWIRARHRRVQGS